MSRQPTHSQKLALAYLLSQGGRAEKVNSKLSNGLLLAQRNGWVEHEGDLKGWRITQVAWKLTEAGWQVARLCDKCRLWDNDGYSQSEGKWLCDGCLTERLIHDQTDRHG